MSTSDHYVAQTYLRHFKNADGKLWVYSKQFQSIRNRSTRAVCAEDGWSNNPFFEDQRVVEKYLKVFENAWNGAVETLSAAKCSWEEYLEAKFNIAGYVAYLKVFSPAATKAGQTTLESILKAEMAVLKNAGQLPPPPRGFEYLLEDLERQVKVEVDQKYPHVIALRSLAQNAEALAAMPWKTIHNPTDIPFVTSDHPACNWIKERSQIGMTFVPLKPNLGVLMLPPLPGSSDADKDERGIATDRFVTQMNELACKSADRIVISNIRSDEILTEVSRYKDWHHGCRTVSFQTPTGVIQAHRWGPMKRFVPAGET